MTYLGVVLKEGTIMERSTTRKLVLGFFAAALMFFGGVGTAAADACSAAQIKKGCEDKTSSQGYKWCSCPAQNYKGGATRGSSGGGRGTLSAPIRGTVTPK
ncbi:MAG: hypothetical protein GY807_16135 [Gammaproteobacteria bacterium]|nr:hypothetical protein [Gammaproteobacteria bacterium]